MVDLSIGLSVSDLLTLAGNAIVVVIIVEIVKRAASLSDETVDRFGAILACGIGAGLAFAVAVLLGRDLPQAVLTGFLAGALAAGLFDVAAKQIGEVVGRMTGRA